MSSQKSTTGLPSLVSLWVISITGDVWLVLLQVSIPIETNLSICLSMEGLSSQILNGLTKKGDSSMTLISALILGQFPISSQSLKAFLYFNIIVIKWDFSLEVGANPPRDIQDLKISAAV